MPKIRQHKRPAVQALLVSPWQKKKEGTCIPQQSPGVFHEPRMYSVQTSKSLLSELHQHNNTAVSAMHETAAPVSVAAPVDSTTKPFLSSDGMPNHCNDSRGSWHVRHKQSAVSAEEPAATSSQISSIHSPSLPDDRSMQEIIEIGHVFVPSSALRTVSQRLAGGEVEGASCAGHVPRMHGSAQLVLFPSGKISGLCNLCSTSGDAGVSDDAGVSYVAGNGSSNSNGQCMRLRIEGQQVLGIHSCYRDPEWALLEVHISHHTGPALQTFAGGKLETGAAAAAAANDEPHVADVCTLQAGTVTWVQRHGGDLMSLRPADIDDEDTQMAIRNSNLGDLPASMCVLDFVPHTLLSGTAAVAVLENLALHSREPLDELVVNLGDVSIAGLPKNFVMR